METEFLRIRAGTVTFDSPTYTLGGLSDGNYANSAVRVGVSSGDNAHWIVDGGSITAERGAVGFGSGVTGAVEFTGGVDVTIDRISLGDSGTGSMVLNGGSSMAFSGAVALDMAVDGGAADLTVAGADTEMIQTNHGFSIGTGTSNILITGGAVVDTIGGANFIGVNGGTHTVTVSGEGTLWRPRLLQLGNSGGSTVATLVIEDGGVVNLHSQESRIGRSSGAQGHVFVTGEGSRLEASTWLRVGDSGGTSSITVTDGGEIRMTGGNSNPGSAGFLLHGPGTLYGDGVVDGNVELRGGTIRPGLPGDGDSDPGTTGLLTLERSLFITTFGEYGGTIALRIRNQTDYDRISVAADFGMRGDIPVSGELGFLEIIAFDDTLISPGDSYQLFDVGGNFTARFEEIVAFALPDGMTWDFDNLYVDGTVSVIPEPSAFLIPLAAVIAGAFIRSRQRR